MPALYRDRDGSLRVRAVVDGKWQTFALAPEGAQYLTGEIGLSAGDHLAAEDLTDLRRRGWAYHAEKPQWTRPDLPPLTRAGRTRLSPVVMRGAVQVRLESADAVLLDQTCAELVQTLFETGCRLVGPIPLPVRVERYRILRPPEAQVIEYRTHKRLIEVRNPRERTSEAMKAVELPRSIDIRVQMRPESA
jgi:ribosomal protein S10